MWMQALQQEKEAVEKALASTQKALQEETHKCAALQHDAEALRAQLKDATAAIERLKTEVNTLEGSLRESNLECGRLREQLSAQVAAAETALRTSVHAKEQAAARHKANLTAIATKVGTVREHIVEATFRVVRYTFTAELPNPCANCLGFVAYGAPAASIADAESA